MESVISSREDINRFLSIDGSGYGDGYGDGSGYGYGYGSGYGYGDDSGYGDGDGYGYSDGDGDGYGYGYGYGNGDGSGYGDIKSVNGYIVDYIDNVPTIILQVKNNYARGYIVGDDLILKPCFIAKVGSSFAHGKSFKEAVTDAREKELKSIPIEEKIEQFKSTFGSMNSTHKGKDFYEWHHILTGSCTMGRDEFCKAHDIDMDADYTVQYFLEITKDSYGRDVIWQLIDYYGNH